MTLHIIYHHKQSFHILTTVTYITIYFYVTAINITRSAMAQKVSVNSSNQLIGVLLKS